jgi:hypothetical protein
MGKLPYQKQCSIYLGITLDVMALRVLGPFLKITRIRLESGGWWLVSGLCDAITVMYVHGTVLLCFFILRDGCLGLNTVVLL